MKVKRQTSDYDPLGLGDGIDLDLIRNLHPDGDLRTSTLGSELRTDADIIEC